MSSVWGKRYPEKKAISQAKYAAANPDKMKETGRSWRNGKSKRAVNLRLARDLRLCVWRGLHGIAVLKAIKLLGCSIETFRAHLEKQFQPGMTWENNTKSGWHIDHIKPCSKFDLTKPRQQRLCFHYTNTQPLWAVDNRKKSNELY